MRGIRILSAAMGLLAGVLQCSAAEAQTPPMTLIVLDGPPRPQAFYIVSQARRPRVRRARLPPAFRAAFERFEATVAEHRRLDRANRAATNAAPPEARLAIDAGFRPRYDALAERIAAARTAALAVEVPDTDGVARLLRAILLLEDAMLEYGRALVTAGPEDPEPRLDISTTVTEALAAAGALHTDGTPLALRYEAWAYYLAAHARAQVDDDEGVLAMTRRGLELPVAKVHAELARLAADAHRARGEREEAAAILERGWRAARDSGYGAVLDVTLYRLAFDRLTLDDQAAARMAALALLARGSGPPAELREEMLRVVVPRLFAADDALPPSITPAERVHVRLAMAWHAANRGDVEGARRAFEVAAVDADAALDEDLTTRVVMATAAFRRLSSEVDAPLIWWLRERLVACGVLSGPLEIQAHAAGWRFVGGAVDPAARRCLPMVRRRRRGEVRRVDIHVRP